MWLSAVDGAVKNDPQKREGVPSVFEGFTFHLLRHTAGSLMARAGYDPAAAAERLEHNDGGVLFLKRYRHLYPGEKRANANRLELLVREELDETGRRTAREPRKGINRPFHTMGRTGHYANRVAATVEGPPVGL